MTGDTSYRGHTTTTMGDKLPNIDLGSVDGSMVANKYTVVDVATTDSTTCAVVESVSSPSDTTTTFSNLKCWGKCNSGTCGYGDLLKRGHQPGTS